MRSRRARTPRSLRWRAQLKPPSRGNGSPVADTSPAADVAGVDGIRIRRRPVTGPAVHYVGPFQFRLENAGNTPRNILEKIVWDKEAEVSQMKERRPLYMLKGSLENAPHARDFVGALKASYDRTGLPALIAEVKKASPSGGVLRENFDPGSFEYLEAVRNAGVKCPLLCKEFIVDAWQLHYARSKGANAVLLIAAVLPDLDIKYMLKICKILRMAALVEVHDEREMDRVLGIDASSLLASITVILRSHSLRTNFLVNILKSSENECKDIIPGELQDLLKQIRN